MRMQTQEMEDQIASERMLMAALMLVVDVGTLRVSSGVDLARRRCGNNDRMEEGVCGNEDVETK